MDQILLRDSEPSMRTPQDRTKQASDTAIDNRDDEANANCRELVPALCDLPALSALPALPALNQESDETSAPDNLLALSDIFTDNSVNERLAGYMKAFKDNLISSLNQKLMVSGLF